MRSPLLRSFGLLIFSILWAVLIVRFPVIWVYTLTVPPILVVNFARDSRLRDQFISIFVVIWLLVFMYNTARHFLLRPLWTKFFPQSAIEFPINKFLFPPAGPIMFYNVDDSFGSFRVSGIKDGQLYELNPHQVVLNRTLFYDNIHRGVLGVVAARESIPDFCRMMVRRFPEFDDIAVGIRQYPSLIRSRTLYKEGWLYRCGQFVTKEGRTP